MNFPKPFILTTWMLLSTVHAFAESGFRDDFSDLAKWKPLTFEKIKAHSSYKIEADPIGGTRLVATTDNAASGLVSTQEFNFKKYPIVRWRWKVDNVYTSALPAEKKGDDYPIRVYLLFKYNPDEAGFFERATFASIRAIYGQYPPRSTLNYVWASGPTPPRGYPSPYTDRARIVPLRVGGAEVGKWVDEEVNVLTDYRAYFGENPPATGALAIMADSDNTKESATAYLKRIEISTR